MNTEPERFATAADVRAAKATMWHTANTAFSKVDRAAFNSWRRHLWKLADQLEDESHGLPDEPRYENLCRLSACIVQMINEIPVMEGRS